MSDPLEKEMATHSSILAWRIPWTEELGGLQSMGHKELDMTERLAHTNTHTHKGDTTEIIKGIDTEFRLKKVRV